MDAALILLVTLLFDAFPERLTRGYTVAGSHASCMFTTTSLDVFA